MTPRRRRGVALILVLWLVVILGAVTSTVVTSTRSSALAVANVRARTTARYAAESGIVLAVATLHDTLRALADPEARRDYLNRLDDVLGRRAETALGDGRMRVVLVDVNARLDLNAAAGGPGLGAFLARFVGAAAAERQARAVADWIGSAPGTERAPATTGGGPPRLALRPLRSLEDLRRVPGFDEALAARIAPYVTVDGDGRINRRTADAVVRAAAGGDLVDEPSRVLVVARGWSTGNALTHEIQALYAIEGNELKLVRWRERDL